MSIEELKELALKELKEKQNMDSSSSDDEVTVTNSQRNKELIEMKRKAKRDALEKSKSRRLEKQKKDKNKKKRDQAKEKSKEKGNSGKRKNLKEEESEQEEETNEQSPNKRSRTIEIGEEIIIEDNINTEISKVPSRYKEFNYIQEKVKENPDKQVLEKRISRAPERYRSPYEMELSSSSETE